MLGSRRGRKENGVKGRERERLSMRERRRNGGLMEEGLLMEGGGRRRGIDEGEDALEARRERGGFLGFVLV